MSTVPKITGTLKHPSTVPQRGSSTFSTDRNIYLSEEPSIIANNNSVIDQINNTVSGMNVVSTEINANAIIVSNQTAEATASAQTAQAAANFQGDWSSATTYSTGQSVYYNGDYFVSKVNSNINHTPSNSDTTYWRNSNDTIYPRGHVGNLSAPLTWLPFKKNLLTQQGQSIVTFSRASTATYIDRYGVLKTSAIDAARFNRDGLLCEGASTNLLTYSEQFDNAAWTKANSTVIANTTDTTDPYGTNLAEVLIDNTATSTHTTGQSFSTASGTSYSFTVFAKKGTLDTLKLIFSTISLWGGSNPFGIFDLSSGTLTSSSGISSYKITACANGWYRIGITATAQASGTSATTIMLRNGADTYTGSGMGSVFIIGAQLEASSFPTSYIPTTTASATRSGQSISISNDENAPFANSSKEPFSIVMDVTLTNTTVNQHIINAGSGSSTHLAVSVASGQLNFSFRGKTISGAITTGTHRIVAVNDSINMKLYLDGVLLAESTIGTVDMVLSGSISVGRYTSSLYPFYGYISSLRIYDMALTGSEARVA